MEVTSTSSLMDIQNLSTLNKKTLASEDANKPNINKPLNEQIKSSNNDTDTVVSLSPEALLRFQATEQTTSNQDTSIGNSEEARNELSQLITTMTNQPSLALKAYGSILPERVGAVLA